MFTYSVTCVDSKNNAIVSFFIDKVKGGFQITTPDGKPVSCVAKKGVLMETLNDIFDEVESHRI